MIHAAEPKRLPPRLRLVIDPETHNQTRDANMDSIIYLVGLVVVVMFVLSLLGLH
jgi:hypothetical protein